MMAALAAAFVFVGCDKTEPTDPGSGNGTEQTDPNNPGGTTNPDGTDPDDPNNPGGTDPENPGGADPENPDGTDPENPDDQIPSISLMEFSSLPVSDQVYRISGIIWEIVDEDYASTNSLGIFMGDVPFHEDLEPENVGYAYIPNLKMPEGVTQNLKDLGFKLGDVLTVIGKKGAEDNWTVPVVADAVYESFKAYDLPFLMFSMDAKPYLQPTNASYALDVYTNCSWSVTLPEGVTANPTSGTGTSVVEFTFPDNTSTEDKFYDVTFEYDGKQVVYKFQQQGVQSFASLSEDFANVAADQTTYELHLTANCAWTVEAPEGVTASPASGNGDATITLTFPANEEPVEVEYMVQILAGSYHLPFQLMQAAAEEQLQTTPISSVLALGNGASIPANTFVEGVVISNMDLNNLTSKKGMYIQDETAGLQFYLAANHTFKFGDKVKVDLSGANVGAYNGAVQISGLALSKIELLSSGNAVEAKTVTITDFLANKYEGQYVAIEGVQVADSDLAKTWGDPNGSSHVSIKIEDADGKSFVVFSSKYASYKSETVAQGSGTLKGISSINNGNMQLIFAQASDYAGLTGARFGGEVVEPEEPETPDTPAATNRADFETFPERYGQYTKEFTSDAGWHTVNCAIQEGYTTDINPQFICIGKVPGTDTWAKAVCINGKTTASGVLESPELTGGCGTLSFNYGNLFSETNGVSFKVEVIQNGSVVKELTFTKANADVPKLTKLEGSIEVNVAGTFKLKFTNLSPTQSTSNKDRVSLWNMTWTSFAN